MICAAAPGPASKPQPHPPSPTHGKHPPPLAATAAKGITPVTQRHTFEGVNAALKSIADNTVRFRAVLARE